jgi:hypothetical protein
MNLGQINERLKDLPMQVIQQYANGMNPEVPPYLALGELQRREMSQKQMANRGGVQGPQPSVKEQVEQKAGLMALQQMQQQQMAQQQAQPQGPMPAPAGVPQPQAQPQPEVMMARGGLASIPVRSDMFEYAGGGIVAFAEGGQPKYETRYDRMNREKAGKEPRVINLPKGTPADEVELIRMQNPDAVVRTEDEGSKLRDIGQAIKRGLTYSSDVEAMKQRAAPAPAGRRMSPTEVAKMLQDPYATGKPIAPEGGLPAALPGATGATEVEPPAPPQPVAQAPAAMPPAAPAGLPGAAQEKSPYFAQMDADLAKPIPAPTPEGIIAQQKALSPEVMQEEFMKKRMQEQRDRAAGERAAFDRTRPSGLDDLIRVFGQAGQYKGLSGTGPAYTANKQQQRAEELAMEKRQNELLSAIDTREYEGGKELFGARSKSMDAANTAYQNQLMTRTKSLAEMAGVDQRRMDEAANRLTQVQLEKMRLAARAAEASRPGEAERIEAKYMSLIANNKPKEAEEYLERILKIKGGAGGDRNPTPTDRLRAAQSIMNDFDSTPEEKAMAKREIAGIMAGGKQEGGGKPITKAEYDKLPKGATYIAPDGTQRTKG